jgi:hypothetical protein
LVGLLLMADWKLRAKIHYILSETAVSAFTGGTSENRGLSRAGHSAAEAGIVKHGGGGTTF